MYKENDNINYAEREKYKNMNPKERDELLEKLEAEAMKNIKK